MNRRKLFPPQFWFWTVNQFNPVVIHRELEDNKLAESIVALIVVLTWLILFVILGVPLAFVRAIYKAPRRWKACRKEEREQNANANQTPLV